MKKSNRCGSSGSIVREKYLKVLSFAENLNALFILAVSLLFVSCRTVQPIFTTTKIDSVVIRDSVYINNFERIVDSVLLSGDTVHHYHTKYIYKELGRVQEQKNVSKDTVNIVRYSEKKQSKSKGNKGFWAFIFLLTLIVTYALGVRRSR